MDTELSEAIQDTIPIPIKYRFQCKHFTNLIYPTHGLITATSKEQRKVEDEVLIRYQYIKLGLERGLNLLSLDRTNHIRFIKTGLFGSIGRFEALDASRAWVVYWTLHSLKLLNACDFTDEERQRIISTYKSFQQPTGGFSGGPKSQAHLAPTYAAVNALVTLGGSDALNVINTGSLRNFLLALKQPDGSFLMHESGEIDVRGVYCAISVASLCGLLPDESITSNSVKWILSCQTYEGGFGGKPGCEAHGGYTFCAIAALTLLGRLQDCNMKSLLRWSVNRQQSLEGGFSGRTNKLVDSCYSFWCGAILPIIQAHIATFSPTSNALPTERWLFNQEALQEYILCCCQSTGLIDKPGKKADYYHTCYALAGLSIAQNSPKILMIPDSVDKPLPSLNPIYNIEADAVDEAEKYFKKK